jgi:hypothetical protein
MVTDLEGGSQTESKVASARAGTFMGAWSPRKKHCSTRPPVCWHCGDVPYLRRDCWQEYVAGCMRQSQQGPEKLNWQGEEGTSTSTPTSSFHTQCISDEEWQGPECWGWTEDKPCLGTVNIRASVTSVRPDITPGLLETEQTQLYVLQLKSGETLPVLEPLVELTLRQCPLQIVPSINKESVLGLVVLCTHEISEHLKHCVLWLDEEVSLWHDHDHSNVWWPATI